MQHTHRLIWVSLAILAPSAQVLAQDTSQENVQDTAQHLTQDRNGQPPARPPAVPTTDKPVSASQVRALIEGTLDPAVEPETLFTVRTVDVEPIIRDQPKKNRDLEPNERALLEARRKFLNLPQARRATILQDHRERQRAARLTAEREAALRQALVTTRTQVEQLQALIDGTLSQKVNLDDLLTINLLEEGELGWDRKRSSAFGPPSTAPPADESDTSAQSPDSPDDELTALRARLDRLRYRYAQLTEEQRVQVMVRHEQNIAASVTNPSEQAARRLSAAEADAADAASARRLALRESREARSEALRLIAEERARLLGVRERQARLSVHLAERRTRIESDRERSLGWVRKVRELTGRSLLDPGRERDADRLYDQLVGALTRTRASLRTRLSNIHSGAPSVPGPGTELALPEHVDHKRVDALRNELKGTEGKLARRAQRIRWLHAEVLLDSVVQMNEARLLLLNQLTPSKQSSLRGFGAEGVHQAAREAEQIGLEAGFHVLSLPRRVQAQIAALGTSPLPLVVILLKFAALIILFRTWRRNAHAWLQGLQTYYENKRPRSSVHRAASVLFWYLQRVRKPLEWLVLVAVLVHVVSTAGTVPEAQFLWIIVRWTLLGSLLIQLVHAVAQRHARGKDTTAALRIRSLRVVGVSVVTIGLILALAEASVGRGAIHNWVRNTCWVVALPVALLLLHWWRPTVLERARAKHNPVALLRWVIAHQDGIVSYPAAAVGGLYLFYEGAKRYMLQQAAHFSIVQRLLAYLFRREVEKQEQARGEQAAHEPLRGPAFDALGSTPGSEPPMDIVAPRDVQRVAELLRAKENTAIAVVGERGLGKTTFVQRVTSGLPTDRIVIIRCLPGGFDGIRAQLCEALGLPPSAEEKDVVGAMGERQPWVIVLDDAHRLVRPLIGGLADMDRLVALARSFSGETVWLLTMDLPAWQYLRRARGDRTMFDTVVHLPRWTEADIRTLVKARSAGVGISPRYDDLRVPRQADMSSPGSEEEDTERDFIRILWDYADGNPAVAMHFYRESLVVRDGQVYVRLFKRPPIADLDGMPSSMHFVLRSIVQLDMATEADVVSCTHLDPAEVADALHAARSRGYIESVDDRVRICTEWYRTITSFLQRQHLLMGSPS